MLQTLSPLAGLVKPGRYGRADGAAGLTVTEISNCAIANILPAPGAAAFQGHPLPEPGKTAVIMEHAAEKWNPVFRKQHAEIKETLAARFIWSGPGQWLALKEGVAPEVFAAELAAALPGAGIVDQSDGFALIRLSGPCARKTLAKGPALDLHPRAFKTGDSALTHLHHIRLTLWQIDEAPSFGLAFPRSYAGSFWHWLEVSAGAEGWEIL